MRFAPSSANKFLIASTAGEGDSFGCGRAGFLRALIELLKASRFEETSEQILNPIRDNAEAMIKSQTRYGKENVFETVICPGDSHPYVVRPMRVRPLTAVDFTMLKRGDPGGTMGLMGILYSLMLAIQEFSRVSQLNESNAHLEEQTMAWQEVCFDAV